MEEIEVGEYVRTRAGHFYKITRIDGNGLIYWNKIQCGWSIEQLKDIVVKHSKQLIDLIRVGNIVNGYRVKAVYLEGATKYIKLSNSYENGQGIRTYEEDIKTILTKESYMANCYKVGGEDEKI